MGADQGSRPIVLAAYNFVVSNPSVTITLFGDARQIEASLPHAHKRITITAAAEVVAMTDKPATALRQKQNSSMALAIKHLACSGADACVSAGNTGALMAFGLSILGPIKGIDRPAICKEVPTKTGGCLVLDLGANLSCTAQNLLQFGLLGAAMSEAAGVKNPRVGLLNVGSEVNKGGAVQQQAVSLLTAANLNFIGNVEGGDIYSGRLDVVVCDGFTGNVMLKACEGAAELMLSSATPYFGGFIGWLFRKRLKRWHRQFDPARYNGAAMLGLNGVLVKSHGASSELGFEAALNVARGQVDSNMLDALQASLKINNL